MPSKFYVDWDQPAQLDPSENGSFENMVIGGMFYCTRQISRITGTPLFTYDEDMKLRVEDPLTVTEAAETADGGKIWVYYRDMLDCTSVVFNGGEARTSRVTPFWNGL